MSPETLFRHGSDWIEWVEATGRVGARRRPVPPQRLSIRFSEAPADLKLVHTPSATKLYRDRLDGSLGILPGALDTSLLPPAPSTLYDLAGLVEDPAGLYLPRRFRCRAGDGSGHALALFRSPLGVSGSPCVLSGTLRVAGGGAVPWALIRLKVSPPVGGDLIFRVQADRNGDFLLPLERVPALPKDAPSPTYPAEVTIATSAHPSPDEPADPDDLPPAQVATGKDGGGLPVFGPRLIVALTPGTSTLLQSPGFGQLLVHAS